MRWKCLQATLDFGNAGSGKVFSKPKILAVFITFLANILRGLVVFASLRVGVHVRFCFQQAPRQKHTRVEYTEAASLLTPSTVSEAKCARP